MQHGKAQLPEEEEFDPDNMFAGRRKAPPGPKREPGQGIATELPKNSKYKHKDMYIVTVFKYEGIFVTLSIGVFGTPL